MRHVTRGLTVGIIVLLAGCRENTPVQPQQPGSIQALIVDGAHSGNKNFFFLPPLVPNPVGSPNFVAGQFNPKLAPVAEVCELTGDPTLATSTNPVDCKSPTDRVFGPASMALDAPNEQYTLNWDTQASALVATSFYRIIVRGARLGTPLGFLDLDPVVGGMKNVKTGDIFVFQDGRTLPIKVRIQQGAFGSTNSNDFVEQVVPNALPVTGLDVTTSTFFAGAHFSNDWIPRVPGTQTPITDQVVVIIERIAVNDAAATTSCLNTPLQQLEGCYRFRTDPDFHTLVPGTDLKFAVPVVAGVCFQFPSEILKKNDPFELYRSQETAEGLALATPLLNEQPAPFLHCDTFGPSSLSLGAAFRSGRLSDIATAGWSALSRGISRIIEPKALLAVDLGAGGGTDGFSRFGYVRPATMTVSVDQATAAAGSTVHASALIQDTHDAPPTPIGGQSVTFTVTSGGGTVSTGSCPEGNSCAATTVSPSGIATVSWRLGAGTNTLQVTASQVSNSPQTLTTFGSGANLVISSFTRSFANPTVADDIVFSAGVQNIGTTTAPASSMTLRVGGETFPPVVAVPALNPGQTFTVNRTVNLNVAQGYIAEAKADVNNDVIETNETDNNQLMTFVVTALQTSISDPTGDAAADPRVSVAPDLTSATAKVDRGNVTFQLHFAPGTFDPNATMATIVIDIDQNTATGFRGVDAANNDASLIGAEYNLEVGSQSVGTTATLFTWNGVGFTSQKVGTITYATDEADVVMALSALGNDRGEMNFKVVVQTQISFPPNGVGYTGIVDYMTDLGSAPGSLVSHPVVVGLVNPNAGPGLNRLSGGEF